MSGARDDRTGYQALLDYIRPGDTIVVTALDLGRSLTSIVNTSATWASAESTSAPCASRSTPSTSVGRMLARAVRQPGRVRAGTDRRAGPRRPAGGRDPWQAARPTAKAPGGQGGPGPAHARRRRVRAHHRPGPGRVPRHAVPGTGESVGVLTAETCRPGSQTSRHSSGHDNRDTLTSASGHGPTAPVGSRALSRPSPYRRTLDRLSRTAVTSRQSASPCRPNPQNPSAFSVTTNTGRMNDAQHPTTAATPVGPDGFLISDNLSAIGSGTIPNDDIPLPKTNPTN